MLNDLPDLEDILNCFLYGNPIYLGDLNVYIDQLHHHRNQQIADFCRHLGW